MLRQKLSVKILVTFLLALLFSLTISPAYACSPAPEALNYTLADRVENAPIILVGTVINGYSSDWGGYSVSEEVEVEVETYLKGEGSAIVRIHGFGWGPDCLSIAPKIGQRVVFFANGDPDGLLQAEYLGVGDATWNAGEATIQTITSITNHSVKPYPLPFTLQVLRFFTHYGIWMIAGLIVFFCVVAIFFVRNLPNEKRKRKAKL